jgi:periplasmic divalent cation tolerance protein
MVTSLSTYASHIFEMTDQIVILSTCASEQEARKLAQLLVERRLAACVNVAPGIRSYYQWKGHIESSDEWLLLIKTSRELFAAVAAAIETEHSYEVPEVIALPIIDGSANYMSWLRSSLRAGPGQES